MSTTAALVEGHYIATESTHRPNGVIVHQAGCQCGAQFEWNGRDKAHARHLLDVVRAEERERIARDIEEQMREEERLEPTDFSKGRFSGLWEGRRIAREGAS